MTQFYVYEHWRRDTRVCFYVGKGSGPRAYVMRAKPGPVAKLLPSAHAVEREFAVMRGLQGSDAVEVLPGALTRNPDEAVLAFKVGGRGQSIPRIKV